MTISPDQQSDIVGTCRELLKQGRPYDHVVAKSEALFVAWTEAFAPMLEEHDVLSVEEEFSFPLLNPETEAPSKSFVEAGKIDGVLRHKWSGQVKVLEHKTTSDKLGPESDYWARLVMNSQISKYILALLQQGRHVNSVLYDVIRKPAQRPAQTPLVDDCGVKVVLDANGHRVRTKDGKKWRETGDAAQGYVLQTREETPQEYHQRILSELRYEPASYFAQKEIPRTDTDLMEYMNDAWALSQQVLYFRRANLWPRNPDACTSFGTCEYFDLCAGRASVDGIRYDLRPRRHAELEIVEDGKEFLTNSRLSTLRQCARKHFLRYEQQVESVGPVDEALRTGTLFHMAAENYLKQFIYNPEKP